MTVQGLHPRGQDTRHCRRYSLLIVSNHGIADLSIIMVGALQGRRQDMMQGLQGRPLSLGMVRIVLVGRTRRRNNKCRQSTTLVVAFRMILHVQQERQVQDRIAGKVRLNLSRRSSTVQCCVSGLVVGRRRRVLWFVWLW